MSNVRHRKRSKQNYRQPKPNRQVPLQLQLEDEPMSEERPPPKKMPIIKNQGQRVKVLRGGNIEDDWNKFTNEFTNPDSLLNQTDDKIRDELNRWGDELGNVFDPNKNGLKEIFEDFSREVGRTFIEIADEVKEGLDPNLNGVNDAFIKFGNDFNGAFESIGRDILKKLEEGWEAYSNVFKPLGELLVDFADKEWWEKTMKDPETYFFLAQCIISCSAVFLGPAGVALASGVVAATRMITKAAMGQDVEYSDLIEMALCLLPTGKIAVGAAQKNATSFSGMVMNGVYTSLNGVRSADPNAKIRAAGQGLCGLVAAGQEYNIIPPVNSQASVNMLYRVAAPALRGLRSDDPEMYKVYVKVYERDKQYDGQESFEVEENDMTNPLPDIQVTTMVKDPSKPQEDYVEFPPLPAGLNYTVGPVKAGIRAGKYLPVIKKRDATKPETKTVKQYGKKKVTKYRDKYSLLNSYTIKEVAFDREFDQKAIATAREREKVALKNIAMWKAQEDKKRATLREEREDPTQDIPLDKIEFTDIKSGKVYNLTRPTRPDMNAPMKVGNVSAYKLPSVAGYNVGDFVARSADMKLMPPIGSETDWAKDPKARYFRCIVSYPKGTTGVNLPDVPNGPALGNKPAKTGETFEIMSQKPLTGGKWIEVLKEEADAANTAGNNATFSNPMEEYQAKVAEYRAAYAAKLANDRLFSQLSRDKAIVADRVSKDFPVTSYEDGKDWIEGIVNNEVKACTDDLKTRRSEAEVKDMFGTVDTVTLKIDYIKKYHETYRNNYAMGPNYFETPAAAEAFYLANPDLDPRKDITKKKVTINNKDENIQELLNRLNEAESKFDESTLFREDPNIGFLSSSGQDSLAVRASEGRLAQYVPNPADGGKTVITEYRSDFTDKQRQIYREKFYDLTGFDEELKDPNWPSPADMDALEYVALLASGLKDVGSRGNNLDESFFKKERTLKDTFKVEDVVTSKGADFLPFTFDTYKQYVTNPYKQLALHMKSIMEPSMNFDPKEQHFCYNPAEHKNYLKIGYQTCFFSKGIKQVLPEGKCKSWRELKEKTKNILMAEYTYEDEGANIATYADRSAAEQAMFGTSPAVKEADWRANFTEFCEWAKFKGRAFPNDVIATTKALHSEEILDPEVAGFRTWKDTDVPIYNAESQQLTIPAATKEHNAGQGYFRIETKGKKPPNTVFQHDPAMFKQYGYEEIKIGIPNSTMNIYYPAFMQAFNENARSINTTAKLAPDVNGTWKQLADAIIDGQRKEIQQKGSDPTKIAEVRNTLGLLQKIEDSYVEKLTARVKADFMAKPPGKIGSVTKRIDPWDTYKGLSLADKSVIQVSDVDKKSVEAFQRGALILAGRDPNFFEEYSNNGLNYVIDKYLALCEIMDRVDPGKNYAGEARARYDTYKAETLKNREHQEKIRSEFIQEKQDLIAVETKRSEYKVAMELKLKEEESKKLQWQTKNQDRIKELIRTLNEGYKYKKEYVTENGQRTLKFSLLPEYDPVVLKAKADAEKKAEELRLAAEAEKVRLDAEKAEQSRLAGIAIDEQRKKEEEERKKREEATLSEFQRMTDPVYIAEQNKLPSFPENFLPGTYDRAVVINGVFKAHHPIIVSRTGTATTTKTINGVEKVVPKENSIVPTVNPGVETVKIISKQGEQGHPKPINLQYANDVKALEDADAAAKAAEDLQFTKKRWPENFPDGEYDRMIKYQTVKTDWFQPILPNSFDKGPVMARIKIKNGAIETIDGGRFNTLGSDMFGPVLLLSNPGEEGHPHERVMRYDLKQGETNDYNWNPNVAPPPPPPPPPPPANPKIFPYDYPNGVYKRDYQWKSKFPSPNGTYQQGVSSNYFQVMNGQILPQSMNTGNFEYKIPSVEGEKGHPITRPYTIGSTKPSGAGAGFREPSYKRRKLNRK